MYQVSIIQKKENNLAQLQEIWTEAFGDSDDYVAFCLSHLPEEVKIIAATENEKILGAVYLFPFMIMPGAIPAYYEYAGAVRQAYQGYSVYTDIMRFAISYTRSRNFHSIGSAANSRLIKPYKRLGFTEIYECSEYTVCPEITEEARSLERRALTIAEWKNMRPTLEAGQYYMLPCDGWLNYIVEEKRYSQDIWETVNIDGVWYTVIGNYVGKSLLIEETSAPKSVIVKNAASLCRTYNADCIKVRFPVTQEYTHTVYNSQGTFRGGYLWTSLIE